MPAVQCTPCSHIACAVGACCACSIGAPHLAQQIWDESVLTSIPLRQLLDQTCQLFPAFPSPFLQLTTGLCQGPAAAAACYSYLCSKPCLAVEYDGKQDVGVMVQGTSAVLVGQDLPWAKAPEVVGTMLPEVCVWGGGEGGLWTGGWSLPFQLAARIMVPWSAVERTEICAASSETAECMEAMHAAGGLETGATNDAQASGVQHTIHDVWGTPQTSLCCLISNI
jgi:hypothetical protein